VISIDVSKCTFVFTYESRLAIHPSLLNRMIEIDLSRYSFTQKLSIVERTRTPRNTTVLDVLKSVDIVSDIAFIKSCIDACSDAPGVYE
jgi:ATP-dependent Lon protease